MLRQVIIEFRRDPSQFREATTRNIRKVVVFIVISHIEGECIQGTVIRVGLSAFHEDVMLGDEMSCHRMKAGAKQGTCDQIQQGPPAPKPYNQRVESQASACICILPSAPLLLIDEDRPNTVEDTLKDYMAEFQKASSENTSLPICGDDNIYSIFSLVLVMVFMVAAESDCRRKHNRQVCNDRKVAIMIHALEAQVMRQLMQSESKYMVARATNEVGSCKEYPTVRISNIMRNGNLDCYDKSHGVFEVRIVSVKLFNVRVFCQNLLAAGSVWFIRVVIEVII